MQHFPAAARRQNTAHSASCGKDEPDNAKPRRGERNATTKDNDEPLRSAARHSRIGSRHQNQPQKRTESPHEDDRADHLQHLHDLRMVRTPEIPRGPLYKVIVVSWLIAFFEYCFQVPANRFGSYEFSAAQLKTIQEVITLTVFAAFSVIYLKQPLRWNYLAGFALIVAAVAVIFKKW